MENASKALIIAGSILVTLLVVSIGIMMFNRMSGSAKKHANLDEQKISAFNSKIKPYLGNNVTGSQVNALINLVTTIDNKALQPPGDDVQRVSIYKEDVGNPIVKLETGATAITGSLEKVKTGKFYKVEGTYDSNGLITKIIVKES